MNNQGSSNTDSLDNLDFPFGPEEDTVTRPINNFNWLNFEYDEARIYLYGLNPKEEEGDPSIIVNNKLNPSVINKEGIKLTDQQIVFANKILSGKFYSEDDNIAASCFMPHHGIVFYKSERPVGYISICLMCHQLRSYPKDGYFDSKALRKLITEVDLPIFKDPLDATEYWKKIK